MLFIETPSNPLNGSADIVEMAQIDRDIGAILAVDSSFCSPPLQASLLLGAGIMTHAVTEYLDGQGRGLGGALVGSEELIAPVVEFIRSYGPSMSASNAWVMLEGLETLDLRMRAHSDNAQRLAERWAKQSSVEAVRYCGVAARKPGLTSMGPS